MSFDHEKDVEAHAEKVSDTYSPEIVDHDNAIRSEAFDARPGFLGKVLRVAGRFGVEQRGIERVPEDERTDTKPYRNIFTMVSIQFDEKLARSRI
jgi:hypothetical protein